MSSRQQAVSEERTLPCSPTASSPAQPTHTATTTIQPSPATPSRSPAQPSAHGVAKDAVAGLHGAVHLADALLVDLAVGVGREGGAAAIGGVRNAADHQPARALSHSIAVLRSEGQGLPLQRRAAVDGPAATRGCGGAGTGREFGGLAGIIWLDKAREKQKEQC